MLLALLFPAAAVAALEPNPVRLGSARGLRAPSAVCTWEIQRLRHLGCVNLVVKFLLYQCLTVCDSQRAVLVDSIHRRLFWSGTALSLCLQVNFRYLRWNLAANGVSDRVLALPWGFGPSDAQMLIEVRPRPFLKQ